MLESKSNEFGNNDKKETYLRVTLGVNHGTSPGIPLVLEIWPYGHYSPIHNHSNCNAIIKVLHGSIGVDWFRELSSTEDYPYDRALLHKGDVTWLDDNHFQTHRLVNSTSDSLSEKTMCATIQSYMYNNEDNIHYEYFDYLDKKGEKKKFTPNTDWNF